MKSLVVVGAGPVGLAVAIAAQRYGVRVTIIDKREPPFDKACGEGIMPAGRRLLAWLGVTPEASPDARLALNATMFGVPFVGIRYIDGSTVAEAHFAEPGLGVRRTELSRALVERARAVGVELHFGVEMYGIRQSRTGAQLDTSHGTLDARVVVGADGLHSRVRQMIGIEATLASVRYGVRKHFRVPPWSRCVEVYWDDACEAYVTPVAADMIGVAIIAHGGSIHFDEAIGRFPTLEARLAGAQALSRLRGAGALYHKVQRRYDGCVALVGDAAGYVDALTGEGLTTGLACARALAETIARDQPLVHYEDRYRDITRTYYGITRFMLAVAERPALRRRLVRVLSRSPWIFTRMLALNAGTPLLRTSRLDAEHTAFA